MNLEMRKIAHECAIRSHQGSIMKLAKAGIERYQADFQKGATTYYLPDGTSHSEALLVPDTEVAADFPHRWSQPRSSPRSVAKSATRSLSIA